jgi:hypothetical protein
MPSRRHSADLRGRRLDLGIGVRDMAAGLGIELGHLLAMEDGTATQEDQTFYLSDVAQQHRRLVRRGKASPAKERECRPLIPHSALTASTRRPGFIL